MEQSGLSLFYFILFYFSRGPGGDTYRIITKNNGMAVQSTDFKSPSQNSIPLAKIWMAA